MLFHEIIIQHTEAIANNNPVYVVQPIKNCLHGEKSFYFSEISPALSEISPRWIEFIRIYTICILKVKFTFCLDLTQVRYPTQVRCLTINSL